MSLATRWTPEMAMALPDDGNRYEVVHGELLVTPAPRALHQVMVSALFEKLLVYLGGLGRPAVALSGPADITWGDDVYVQPDLLVVPPSEVTRDWRTYKSLLLVIEVLSPSSRHGDRVIKRRAYQENRVGAYWIVDIDARAVEVWHPESTAPEILTDTLRWQVSPDAPALVVDLRDLFAKLPA